MNQELMDEVNYEIQLLIKSGFYSGDEILEIIDDEFIEENISKDILSKLFFENKENIGAIDVDSEDFINLKNAFLDLTKENIISIHNAGYDIEEGIQDSFELFVHLRNNKYSPIGFCFYSFEDIEEAIEENNLSIAFGDFEYDEEKGLEIAKTVVNVLKSYGFKINWNESVDERIELLEKVTKGIPNVYVETFDGLTVDFGRKIGASVIVRGLRAITDFEYELQIAQINHKLNPEIDTIFFTTSQEYSYVSSSIAKEIALYGGDISGIVPESIRDDLFRKVKERTKNK